MLDSALQVNMQEYTSGLWDKIDLSKTLAGSDPLWRQMMVTGYTDCFSIAQSWPQESLDRHPLSKVFGRHMIFFKCAAVSVLMFSKWCLLDHKFYPREYRRSAAMRLRCTTGSRPCMEKIPLSTGPSLDSPTTSMSWLPSLSRWWLKLPVMRRSSLEISFMEIITCKI